ncbi:MAG TPA: ABC transporter substrate-binding protein [Sporichthyaceae bacterium]|jgi:ABC-type branched-subunit amino acid transport system substrate-binding protein
MTERPVLPGTPAQRLYHGKPIEPYRLGVIVDLPEHPGLSDAFPDMVQFALDEAHARGVVERPVELVVREVFGQPWTSSHSLRRVYGELVEHDVLGVIGPFTTDNSLAVLDLTEAHRLPTMSICGSLHWRGPYAFVIPNGGLADEPYVMTSWLAAQGHRRVGVLRERTQIGEEYAEHFRRAVQLSGLTVVAEPPVYPSMHVDELVRALEECRSAGPDALVYLGLGGINQTVRPALEKLGWDPPRIQTTAYVSAGYSEERARRIEGWVGVDQYHEGNDAYAAVLDRFAQRYGYRPANSGGSCGYDIGHAFAHGLGRMRHASPWGLRDALETVRRLPACTGGPGTTITFGPQDHRGLKGPDFLVLRRSVDGRSVLEGTAAISGWTQPTG